MTCKTCRFLDVAPNAAGRIVVRKNDAYSCEAPEPALPTLPDSVTVQFSWTWPPHRRFMNGDGGKGCPVHEARKK